MVVDGAGLGAHGGDGFDVLHVVVVATHTVREKGEQGSGSTLPLVVAKDFQYETHTLHRRFFLFC